MNRHKLFLLLLIVLAIAGCGGEESTPTSPTPTPDETGESSSNFLAPLGSFAVVKPYQEEEVRLAEHIPLYAKITDVVNESGDPLCDVTETSNNGFKVKIDELRLCQYSFLVQTATADVSNTVKVLTAKPLLKSAANGARANTDYKANITVLTSTSVSSILTPIAIAMNSNSTLTINLPSHLGSRYPTGYILQDGPILAGNGQVLSIDKTQQSITFKAGSEGVSRITYTVKGTNGAGEEDLNLGVIDIAASDSANRPPVANAFTFATEQMVNAAAINIDVTPYISSLDGGDLQLVYVSSATATVTMKAPILNGTNKVFTFAASTPGTHMVSYAISDHRGGYAVVVIQVHVSGLVYSQWNSLFHNGNMFTAPLTALEATALGVTATSLTDFKETTYTPSIPMATFNLEDAKKYCELVHKGRLPTWDELIDFINPIKPHSPLMFSKGHWPVSANYYLSEGRSYPWGADNTAWLYEIGTGPGNEGGQTSYPIPSQTSFYVTCVVPLNVTFSTTVTSNDVVVNNVVANNTATIDVKVTVVDSLGSNSNGGMISVDVLEPQGVTLIDSQNTQKQMVLASGNTFKFKSTKAATVPLKFDYNGNTFLTNVTFVADRATARIAELEVIRNGQPAGRPYLHNAVSLTVLDAFNNPVPNMKMVISGGNNKATFFAHTPDVATDDIGRLTDYQIRLLSLPYGKFTQTDLMTIKLELGTVEEVVEFTNTYAAATAWHGSKTLVTAAALESEVILFLSATIGRGDGQYITKTDQTTGLTYALMNQNTAVLFCKALVKHGYDDWELGDYLDMGYLIRNSWLEDSVNQGVNTYGWPIGVYWSSTNFNVGAPPESSATATYTNGNNYGTTKGAAYLVPCSRYNP